MFILLSDPTLLELAVNYLPAGLITIFLTTFVILAILGKVKDVLNGFISLFKKDKKPKEIQITQTIDELNNHQFFNFMDYAIKYRIPKLKLDCDARSSMIRKILNYKCRVFYRRAKVLLELDLDSLSVKELQKIVMTDIFEGIKEYEILTLADADNPEEKLILKVVVDRVSIWHNKNVEAAYKVIENIFDSEKIYHNNYERINGVLNVYLFAFCSAFTDAEKALYSLNGEISGKLYKGKKIK